MKVSIFFEYEYTEHDTFGVIATINGMHVLKAYGPTLEQAHINCRLSIEEFLRKMRDKNAIQKT